MSGVVCDPGPDADDVAVAVALDRHRRPERQVQRARGVTALVTLKLDDHRRSAASAGSAGLVTRIWCDRRPRTVHREKQEQQGRSQLRLLSTLSGDFNARRSFRERSFGQAPNARSPRATSCGVRFCTRGSSAMPSSYAPPVAAHTADVNHVARGEREIKRMGFQSLPGSPAYFSLRPRRLSGQISAAVAS